MNRRGRKILAAACALACCATVRAASVAVTKLRTDVIDARGMTLGTGAPYGVAINGESFEGQTLTSLNGWQYTSYWVKGASDYHLAVARRKVGVTGWQVVDLATTFVNGMSGGVPWDAHNVSALGIDTIDGTLHLVYDVHSQTMKYRTTVTGVATNPDSITWDASLFTPERSNLITGTGAINTVTYPQFIRTPSGDLQLGIRSGVSGNGSNWIYNYSGATSSWTSGHQYDSGSGTYSVLGTTQRNAYINGLSYGADGRLYTTFTWREGGGSSNGSNHDIDYAYSTDGGNTWFNNANTKISDQVAGGAPATFNVNTAGLIVRPLLQTNSLMNQQTQAVDADNRTHAVMWHLDPALTDNVFHTAYDSQRSSYFHVWRDNNGGWHEDRLPGIVGMRPKVIFDSSGNAIVTYNSDPTTGNWNSPNNQAYILVATKATHWTDWQVVANEPGSFVNETAIDSSLFASNGTLSTFQQFSPTSSAQATTMETIDYSLTITPPTDKMFNVASSNWNTAGNWTASGVPTGNQNAIVANGRTAIVSSASPTVGGDIAIGTAAGNGTLSITGGSLAVTNSLIVGRDGSAVGTYNQSGGTVSAHRFAVGDWFTETSGGGPSAATVSGGSLAISDDLQIGIAKGGVATGSTFTVSGTGSVTVGGSVILGDFNAAAALNLNGGSITVTGDITGGLNGAASTLAFNGGTLDMTSNPINVDTLVLNSGLLQNAGPINGAVTIDKNSAGVMRLAGSNTFANPITITTGSLRVESNAALGTTSGNTTVTGGTATGQLELANNITLAEPIVLAGRQGTGADAPQIDNISGNNTISSAINTTISGNQYNVASDGGLLTITGKFQNNQSGTAGDVRTLKLMGAGNGVWNGLIADNSALSNPSKTELTKVGAGTWTLGTADTYTGATNVNGGTLVIAAAASIASTNIAVGAAGTLNVIGSVPSTPTVGCSGSVILGGNAGTGSLTRQLAVLNLASGGSATLNTSAFAEHPALLNVATLSFADNTASLDLTNNELITTATASAIRAAIIANEIRTTTPGGAIGYLDLGGGQIEARFTLLGDTNLDGTVDVGDLGSLASNYGATTGGTWAGGDFNYDDQVDVADLGALATYYGSSLANGSKTSIAVATAVPSSNVPEPAAAVGALIGMACLSRRRRS